jgi:hypothetical protein
MPAKLQTAHTAPKAPKQEATVKSSIGSRALTIISKETAIKVAKLTEDVLFLSRHQLADVSDAGAEIPQRT